MSLAVVLSRASTGIHAPLVTIEVHLANGLPAFHLVGLPEAAVREARDRVRSALLNSGFEFPSKRITVNLAPAELPKEGGRFDLAIAIGIIAATGMISREALRDSEFVGELALSGDIRPVPGILPFSCACHKDRHTGYLPQENCAEASLIPDSQLIPAASLSKVFLHLTGQSKIDPYFARQSIDKPQYLIDMHDIIGQAAAKRALEIGAAGGHNLLFCGPPGTGKTMLAHRLVTLLPDMDHEQALETATIHSVFGSSVNPATWTQRQFRQPHHTSSAVSLVGGGSNPKPGEASLAHNGVLFLDELPEFERRVLDVLREPLESGSVSIARAARHVTFPARFQLVAAMNPSPTGSLHDGRSSPERILRYLNRISGPFLDRIDLQVDVPKLTSDDFNQAEQNIGESSASIKQRVLLARDLQMQRAGKCNAQLSNAEVKRFCVLKSDDKRFLQHAVETLGMSMRAFHRVVKVARTIADLDTAATIQRRHLAEALGYRALDKIIHQLST